MDMEHKVEVEVCAYSLESCLNGANGGGGSGGIVYGYV